MEILFLGGDSRQEHACEYLRDQGYNSYCFRNFDLDDDFAKKIFDSDIVVFPLPFSKDGINLNMDFMSIDIDTILSKMSSNSIIFGGNIPKAVIGKLDKQNIRCIDYYENESFQVHNALLSAEGAIYYAKARYERSIYGSNIAILGFGRIGKILAYLLHAQGADVTICARKNSDLIWSKLIGFNIASIKEPGIDIASKWEYFDIIFNTVPYWVLNDDLAKKIHAKTQVIDLASSPYGMDSALVEKYEINYRRELSIPGRYAPQSAGILIAEAIVEYINNMEDNL